MYQANTSGSAASNITFSMPSAFAIFAGTSVQIGIQFGAGGATAAEELAAEGTRDPDGAIAQAKRFIDAGAYMIMIESEGITENVKTWPGLAFRPAFCTLSTSRNQSSEGMMMKPLDI